MNNSNTVQKYKFANFKVITLGLGLVATGIIMGLVYIHYDKSQSSNNLTTDTVFGNSRVSEQIWNDLKNSNGNLSVIYVFMDPNCIYCHKLWLRLRQSKNDLQIRNILVGLIKPSSFSRAVTIIDAKNSLDALDFNELNFKSAPGENSDGGIAIEQNMSTIAQQKIRENTELFNKLSINAVPCIFYKMQGQVYKFVGLPNPLELRQIMGASLK